MIDRDVGLRTVHEAGDDQDDRERDGVDEAQGSARAEHEGSYSGQGQRPVNGPDGANRAAPNIA